MANYLLNLITLLRGKSALRPLVSVFHLTGRCNLNCAYCEDYGARRPDDELMELGTLSLTEAGQVLTILRQAAPDLAAQCPYKKYFGKRFLLVKITCDFCGKVMAEMPLDKNIKINLDAQAICNKCLAKPQNVFMKDILIDGIEDVITEDVARKMMKNVSKN